MYRLCNSSTSLANRFTRKPFIIIIETASVLNAMIYDLPKELVINNRKYCLLMITAYIEERNHFVSLFLLNSLIHFVNDKPYYNIGK